MVFRTIRVILFLFLIACIAGALPLWAQSTSSGTVAGTVTDASGAVVSGATVRLTDIATNTPRTTTTNEAGRYIFVDVNPGMYNVDINKQGFSTTKVSNQEVKVGIALTLNASLQVGGTSTVVEVEATGTELQTMNATVGNTVTAATIDNLPSIGRDVNTFIELQPGVGADGSVAGAVVDESYFSLDGGNNTNDMDGAGSVYTYGVATNTIGDPTGGVSAQYTSYNKPSGVMPTPADSVEEFKVNTANQTADFNSSSGAEIKVVTKRGSNTFHGTAYEYYRDNNWAGNTWDNSYNGIQLPSYHYSRFGFALGGPLIPKEVAGGKTYFFVNYEGFRYPSSETFFRNVPSAALKAGNLTDTNGVTYSILASDPRGLGLNPIVSQVWSQYMPASNAACSAGSQCDGANIQGFAANLNLPLRSNFGVMRLDHDFGAKQHFTATYHYFNQFEATDDQVDIGGMLPGDKLGVPASHSSDPVEPWFLTLGLTSNITNNTTNDIHYSYTRNWWAWNRGGDIIQTCPLCAGLGAALEFESGQSKLQDLGPYNVNTQQTRTRFWDGKDNMIRDDISMLKGNHLFQFGGTYQHNFNWHQRTDNGGGINYQPVYELGNGTSGSELSAGTSNFAVCSNPIFTNTPPSGKCDSLMAAALGIVSISQVAYTRAGNDLHLTPGQPAFDQSRIPYYNVYFSDTWHLKPTFTFTYGLGWALEMPPVEASGKQIEFVDASDQPINALAYIKSRERAALQGQVFNPQVGFALVGDTANGLKYPYNPFYGQFSPRVAFAWAPKSTNSFLADTVVRGGYGRQYGRLNGVDLVLVPLLGTGLIQPVQCIGGGFGTGPNAGACAGNKTADPTNAFRVGVDGLVAPLPAASQTLPQPDYPGINAIAAGAGEGLDPNFRPNVIDSFDLTIQKQVNRRTSLEVGYIGRRITHEYLPLDVNAVPYMMTLGGQKFSDAYKNLVLQYCGGVAGLAAGGCAGANPVAATPVTAQPFFEAALAGTGYCNGFTSCTQAVVFNEGLQYGPGCPGPSCAPVNPNATGNLPGASVWNLWSDLDNGGFNFPRSMMNTPLPGTAPCPGSTSTTPCGAQGQLTSGVGINASVGTANYNAAFLSIKMADWKGLTMQTNLTYSKALGEGAFVQATSEYTAEDIFNLKEMYGRQGFDRKYTYNTFLVYQPPFFKGQQGIMGRALGGWSFGAIFAAGSGTPNQIYTTGGSSEEFGAGDATNFFSNQNAVPLGPYTSGKRYPDAAAGLAGQLPFNIFKNGEAEAANWRNPILGLDNRNGGAGILGGLPYWNMDFSMKKNIRVAERVSLELQGVFGNVFNHDQFHDPQWNATTALSDGTDPGGGFGTLTGGEAQPRQIEIGARVRF